MRRTASTRMPCAIVFRAACVSRRRPRCCSARGIHGHFVRGCAAYKIFRFLRLASRFSHVRGLSAATAARTDAVASCPERREKRCSPTERADVRVSESGRINLRTRTYDVIRRIYLSYFGTRAHLFRRHGSKYGTLSPVFPFCGATRRGWIRGFMRVGEERNVLLSILSQDGRKGRRRRAFLLRRSIYRSIVSRPLAHLVSVSSRSLRSMVSVDIGDMSVLSLSRCRIRTSYNTPAPFRYRLVACQIFDKSQHNHVRSTNLSWFTFVYLTLLRDRREFSSTCDENKKRKIVNV